MFMPKKQQPAEIFRTNLQGLITKTGMKISRLERETGVSARMIRFILDGERKPTIEVADSIARGFGLNGWQMLLPNLLKDLNCSKQLAQLVEMFIDTPDDGQDYILRVAEKESKYNH